jgi:hypothetical protein
MVELGKNRTIVPVDYFGQGTEPRDEAIIVKPCHPGMSFPQRMNKGMAQEDAGCTAPCNGLIEIEHGWGHLPIRPRHTLCCRGLYETIF